METLDELAKLHRTDKASGLHGYTRIYATFFEPLRMEEVRLIEIGIAGGESLSMWRDYFPNGRIWGVDAEPSYCGHRLGKRVRCVNKYQEDVSGMEALGQLVKPHIVIDDGGHFAVPQLASFTALWPQLEPGGYYCIEDLHTAYWPNRGSIMPHLHYLIDEMNRCGRVEYADQMDAAAEPGMKVGSVHFYQSMVIARKALG